MKGIVSLVMALSLLLLQVAAASRYCACLEAAGKQSCCEKQMPCCVDGECRMHPDASANPDLALDLFKALDAVASLPLVILAPATVAEFEIVALCAPRTVRVRGPDCVSHALRAPPLQA